MTDMVLDAQTLPETIFSRIPGGKVLFHEENGSIVLTPIAETAPDIDSLFGMFSDGRISTEKYLREKQLEKELEN